MKKDAKIVIVGAGPVGCYTGKLLQSYGYDPLVIEEHPEIGKPVQCAGIVGKDVFEKTQIPLSRKSILNSIEGAHVSFNGSSFRLKRPSVAYVINREVFDKNLAEGLNIKLGTRFIEINKPNGSYLLETTDGILEADLVIGADGPNSRVRRLGEFRSNLKLYRGLQYRVKVELPEKKKVDVRYIKPFSLFSWMIPEGNGVVRVGAISGSPAEHIEAYMKERGFSGDIVEKNAGLIPIGVTRLVKDNMVLVGDAACQVKPISSGGIFYGLRSAEILAKAINKGDLGSYEARWRKEFGREIQTSLLIRYVMENIHPDILHSLFLLFKDSVKQIEKDGDFETHTSVLRAILRNRKFYPLFLRALLEVLRQPRLLVRILRTKISV